MSLKAKEQDMRRDHRPIAPSRFTPAQMHDVATAIREPIQGLSNSSESN
jgi:hypothetical protein